VAHGYKEDSALPVRYRNCTLISNVCNVRFGDDYSRGSNHRIERCKLVKSGNNPKYHTFVFDGGYWTRNHVVLDCEFEGGARFDDVYWRRVSAKANYSVAWTLELKAAPGAKVVIKDKNGKEVFSGAADANGKASAPLTQCIIRPQGWRPGGGGGGGGGGAVGPKTAHQKEDLNPYTVTVGGSSKTVTMTRRTAYEVAGGKWRELDPEPIKYMELAGKTPEGIKLAEGAVGARGGAGRSVASSRPAARTVSRNGGGNGHSRKAAKLYRSARQAERQGMKPLARRLYEKLVTEYPDSPLAVKAKGRLE